MAIVSRALKKDPAERYPDAHAMAADLRAGGVHAIGGAGQASVLPRGRWLAREAFPRRGLFGVGILLTVAIVAAVVLPRLDLFSGGGDIREPPSIPTPPTVAAPALDPTARAAEHRRRLEFIESRLQAADPPGALATIEAGLRVAPGDPDYTRLLRQLFADARQNAEAAQARARPIVRTQEERVQQVFDGMSAMMTKAAEATNIEELPDAIRILWTTEAAFREFETSPSRR